MRILVIILSLINGLYMLIDGIYVIINGKYIGPEKPGPWANLFYKMEIDVFKLGPMFTIYGLLWLIFMFVVFNNYTWAPMFGIVISACTLWYFPFGSITSIIILAAVLMNKIR
jgi:hypothetical protein